MMTYRTSYDLNRVRDQLSRSSEYPSCWHATLGAFGVTPARPPRRKSLMELNGELGRAGWTVTPLPRQYYPGRPLYRIKKTALGRFIDDHPTGSYVLSVYAHVMALRDGQLTDTDLTGSGLRRIDLAYLITRSS
jgi:hypothetical protein